MSKLLPFSRRTTTAVVVFACLFATRDAWHLTMVEAQVSSLHLIHAQLFHLYRQLRHQDIAAQAEVLDALITQSATVIDNLNTVVQAIESQPLHNQPMLSDVQSLTANAVYTMSVVETA